jgi:DNA repair exonuclease SbcCD ATPase subunit
MKIKNLEANNFYSIKNVKLDFEKYDGLVLIEGKNLDTGDSNGSGKSSIIEAVVWGLFGKTIRKSNESALVNIKNPKKCYVRMEVDDVVIDRGKKPAYLRIWINGEEKTQNSILQTQRLLEEHLNTNYKIFLASTVFGQENNIHFVGSSPDDKRIIIKNFLDQGQLFEYRESVKFLKSNFNQEIKNLEAIINEYTSSIEDIDSKLDKLNVLKKEIAAGYSEDVLSMSIEEIMDKETTNGKLETKKHKLTAELGSVKHKIDKVKRELKNPKSDCPTCSQPFPDMDKRIADLKTQDSELKEKAKKLEYDIKICDKNKVKIEVTSADYKKVLHYQSLKKEEDTFVAVKKQQIERIEEAYTKQKVASKNYDIMRFWEKAFSESGLVRFLIRNILKYFNDRTNFYLSHLSRGKFSIEFDEELNETITHYGRKIDFISMSGGEKKKVSLAVTLGLQSLLTRTSRSENNLIFFDEIAESLDQDGIYGLYILLQELKKDKVLFVITHNNYLKSLLDNSKTLTIMKSDGISSLKE